MSTLPDFLLAGGTEQEWRQAQTAAAVAGTTAVVWPSLIEEQESAEDSGAEEEVLLEQPEPEATPDAAESDSGSDGEEEAGGGGGGGGGSALLGRPSLLGPLASTPNASMLIDEEDLCVGGAAAAAVGVGSAGPDGAAVPVDDSLVEFEILIDGEVVGSTFLPKQQAGQAPAALGEHAAAEAVRNARKRKFEERMGVTPKTAAQQAAAAAAAAGGPFVPQPPALCSACQKQKAKYTCPKCEIGSCSLVCVNAHKTSTGCSGVRARSSFVPLGAMTANTLSADLGFLTDMERMAGAAARDQRMKDTVGNAIILEKKDGAAIPAANPAAAVGDLFGCTAEHIDNRSFTLMSACQQQRSCRLMMMPQGMKMHTQNVSRVYALSTAPPPPSSSKGKHKGGASSSRPRPGLPDLSPSCSCIKWTVHIIFKHQALTQTGPQSDLKIVKHKVDERLNWAQLLDSMLIAPPAAALTASDVSSSSAATATAATAAMDAVKAASDRRAVLQAVHPSRQQNTQTKAAAVTLKSTSTALLRHQLAAFVPPPSDPTDTTVSSSSSSSASSTPASAYSHLALLLPVPFQPANAPLFHRLNPSTSILTSLQNLIVVEHPVLWVVTAQDLETHGYKIAPSSAAAAKKKDGAAKKEEGPPPPRKKRRAATTEAEAEGKEQTETGAAMEPTAAAAASSPPRSSSDAPVAARPAPASIISHLPPRPAPSSPGDNSSFRGRGGSRGRGGGGAGRGGGGWVDRGGGGRGGRGRGGGGWSDRGGRGGGGVGSNDRDRGRGGSGARGAAPAAASFSFGVAKPAAPVQPPPPPPPPPATSLFKKWT